MHTFAIVPRRMPAIAAMVVALAGLAACSDSLPTTPVSEPGAPQVPAGTLASIPCAVDVRAGTLLCSGTAGGARGDRIFGGQGVNVKLTSSNVVYDSAAQTLSADVTVQNLLVQRMGSDGSTVSGVKVFFATGPAVVSGSGVVDVANEDGDDLFTASGQPYFYYPGAIPADSVSATRRWTFSVPVAVTSFTFSVYVAAPLVPVVVFEMAPAGNRDVYRMGIDGNDIRKLTTSPAKDSNPTVAEGRVVFVSYRDGNAELYSVPLKGGTETRLTSTTTVTEAAPALSPDGTKLAWTRSASGGLYKLWYGNADATGGLPVISNTGDAIESTPNWASGTLLAYGSTAAASNDIYSITPGSGSPTLLAGGDQAEVEPAWSPDGKRLVFASNRTRDTELYVLNVETSALSRLTTRNGSDGAPTWLKDGRIVYTCVQGVTLRLCIVDPANPSGAAVITTPYAADHASAVRF